MAKKQWGGKKKATPPSLDDELQAEATQKAGAAMFPLLEQFTEKNFNRPITSLTKHEIEWLAVAAITGWVLCRAEQAKTYGEDVAELIKRIEL